MRKDWHIWAPAAPITSSARRSGRCMCPGIRKTILRDCAEAIDDALAHYRKEYADYYRNHAKPEDPGHARCQPHRSADSRHRHVQLRQEQDRIAHHRRILCQCHPRDGRRLGARTTGAPPEVLPQAGPAAESASFQVHRNYVALPPSEAFRIEYWVLEEAKIRRQPPEKELSRHIVLVVGGGSGIGREVVRLRRRARRACGGCRSRSGRRSTSRRASRRDCRQRISARRCGRYPRPRAIRAPAAQSRGRVRRRRYSRQHGRDLSIFCRMASSPMSNGPRLWR